MFAERKDKNALCISKALIARVEFKTNGQNRPFCFILTVNAKISKVSHVGHVQKATF